MNDSIRFAAWIAVAAVALTGCGGGSHITSVDKTLIHSGGTLNLSQIKSTSGKIEVRSGSGDWQDMTSAKKKDIEVWFEGKSSVEARSMIIFDDFNLALDSEKPTKAGQLTDMQDYLHKRLGEVQDFLKNNNKQLDARKW